jgi:hypothetical protein
MTLKQHIDRTAKQCRIAAETCWEVGDPICDCFDDILKEFATNILADEDVPKP